MAALFKIGTGLAGLGILCLLVNGSYLLIHGHNVSVVDIHADTVGGIVVGVGLITLGWPLAKIGYRSL